MFALLQNILVGVLSAYLALTNTMAVVVTDVFSLEASDTGEQYTKADERLTTLPSDYQFGGAIPDILIKHAGFQQAAVIASDLNGDDHEADDLAEAIVNIYCTYRTATHLHTTTGSGFFVSSSGVILTNAHVAQFLLLDGVPGYGEPECMVRTGATATPTYEVGLLYISPAWIQANADLIKQAKPMGTGERDYALLYITAGTASAVLPAQVPYLPVDTDLLTTETKHDGVVVGGYPATALLAGGSDAALTREIATSTIAELFTFGSSYADIFYLTGSRVGEHGVSGGPVINDHGDVIGMVSTKSNDESLGAGSLSAITLSYIDRTITEETGFSLSKNIAGNLPYRSAVFKETIVPFLEDILAGEL